MIKKRRLLPEAAFFCARFLYPVPGAGAIFGHDRPLVSFMGGSFQNQ
jgi:hypothetical protein